MVGRGKRYRKISEMVEKDKRYSFQDAVQLIKKMDKAKFDETVDVAFNLGVDPKQSDQMVRASVSLPNGTGKEVKILVITKGEKINEAKDAGVDYVGGQDMIDKISKGWLDFDAVVATPDMMKDVARLGKILGPRGLMPSPKAGTVSFELKSVIDEIKKGKVDFRIDKQANLQTVIGKLSFDEKALLENLKVVVDAVVKAKPATSKGVYIKTGTLSSTMGPGISLDVSGLI